MPFPDAKRIVYKKNTLKNVICQWRFPPILRIDSEIPSQFQEKIKSEFPLYRENKEQIPELPNLSLQNLQINQIVMKSSDIKNHEFLSADEVLKVNLTRTFIALSTSQYKKWEDFLDIFKKLIDSLFEIYSPSFITRVGLRYINIFDRRVLDLRDTEWKELLNPLLVGLLSTEFKNNIDVFESIYEIKLIDNISKVRIATSLVEEINTKEKSFMVDSDFSHSKRASQDLAMEKLEFLHQRSTRLIRYIVTDKLHNAMEPEVI
ncbi:MAG: TIGR04255 family protein [Ignavibacteriaceae bacterium]